MIAFWAVLLVLWQKSVLESMLGFGKCPRPGGGGGGGVAGHSEIVGICVYKKTLWLKIVSEGQK